MGRPAQRRIIRKIDLELFLQKIKSNPSPKVSLEQYSVTQDVAAIVLHTAAYHYGDIMGKNVLELGCGTGRLSLGAAFLGAESAVGIDLAENAAHLGFYMNR